MSDQKNHLNMRRWLRRAVVAGVFVGVASSPLWFNSGSFAQERTAEQQGREKPAQPPTEEETAEMMKRFAELATPGKFHETLKSLAGKWDVTAEFSTPAGTMTSTGKSNSEFVLGDRFLRQEFGGDMQGQPFNGIGYIGYDNATKKYQSTWMDSMSTAIFYMEGQPGGDGKSISLTGEGFDPMSNAMKKYHHVFRVISNDQHVLEMYEPGAGGQETKVATLTYKRAK